MKCGYNMRHKRMGEKIMIQIFADKETEKSLSSKIFKKITTKYSEDSY